MFKLNRFVAIILVATLSSIQGEIPTKIPFGGRIIGGKQAQPNQFPHQISIQMGAIKDHNCGGTIIAPNWILTAAHCTNNENIKDYTIVAGTINHLDRKVERKLQRIIRHEGYDDAGIQNDIALLELAEPLQFSRSVQSIELFRGDVVAKEQVIISGWGRNDSSGQIPDMLQYTDELNIMSVPTCRRILDPYSDEGIICLDHDEDVGCCFGDSGGPAVYRGQLLGVANFVLGGCASNNPDGYARVLYFYNWIHKNTGGVV